VLIAVLQLLELQQAIVDWETVCETLLEASSTETIVRGDHLKF